MATVEAHTLKIEYPKFKRFGQIGFPRIKTVNFQFTNKKPPGIFDSSEGRWQFECPPLEGAIGTLNDLLSKVSLCPNYSLETMRERSAFNLEFDPDFKPSEDSLYGRVQILAKCPFCHQQRSFASKEFDLKNEWPPSLEIQIYPLTCEFTSISSACSTRHQGGPMISINEGKK